MTQTGLFLVKYDIDGNALWAKDPGGTANSVAMDASGYVYMTGFFANGPIIFGTDTLINTSWADIFLVKYDANGNETGAITVGAQYDDVGNSVAVDALGNIYLAGYFENSPITFGNTTLTNEGGFDIFLAKAGSNILMSCDAKFTIAPDVPHHYIITNLAYGITAYPSHTYPNAGDYNICQTITASDGCTTTFCDTLHGQKSTNSVLYVDVIPPSGINENSLPNKIKVFPNPATDNIIIESPQQAVIEISNIEGQIINRLKIKDNKTDIDISDFASGVYIIRAQTDSGIKTEKFIKE